MDSGIIEADSRHWPLDSFSEKVTSAREGSAEALGEMFETCRQYLLAVGEEQLDADLRAKFTASDIVQETFLEAHRDFQQFRGVSQPDLLVWLRRIMLNNIFNLRRHYRETQKRSLSREESLDDRRPDDSLLMGAVADVATPSRRMMAEEDTARVEKALARLSPTQRQLIMLRNYLRWSFNEIGVFLGRTPEAARKGWARSIERLQHELEREP